MSHPTFRLVRPAQGDELLDIIRRYYAEDDIPFDEKLVRHGVTQLLEDGSLGQGFFLHDPNGTRVGYVVFTFGFDHEVGGRLATVTDLFIEPTHRRQGLAKMSLDFVAETCRALGIRGLELQHERHNLAGQALYQNFGFGAADRVPMFLPLDLR